MANMSDKWHRTEKIDSSSIVEMEVVDGDESDYETSFTSRSDDDTRKRTTEPADDFKAQVTKNMTSYMWEAGKQQAQKAFTIYTNIDILRPYFDVEPQTVQKRLLQSFVPVRPGGASERHHLSRELYGPTMVVLTLIALLLFQMKSSEHSVEEGTLMGSAFMMCFGYWLGSSALLWVMTYVCNTQISLIQILSLLGYGLTGHCVVLFLTTVVHSIHSHVFFYSLWAVCCGLTSLRIVSLLAPRTKGRTQQLVVCVTVAALHMLFLLYLHFAYHRIVEDISHVIDDGSPVRHLPRHADIKILPSHALTSKAAADLHKPLLHVTRAAGGLARVTRATLVKSHV